MENYINTTAGVVRASDGAVIPRDPINRDYQDYLAWVGEGNVPDEQVIDTRPMVDLERDLRINSGVTFQGVRYQSGNSDRENIAGASQMAFMAIIAGVEPGDLRWHGGTSDFQWIALDNTRVPMDAQTMVDFGKTAALYKQGLVFAGSNLKRMSPVPGDFTDDKWWLG